MAPEDRPPTQHLSFLRTAAETVKRWGLFPMVRAAEARAPQLPRVGRARTPAQNIVDLTSSPSMSFAQTTLDRVEEKHGRARIRGLWPGLIGPMGALPTHLTEFAIYEARYAKARPFGEWLDVLAGRQLQFFYRAWADSQPTASLDRPDDDRFGDYLAALTGAREGVQADSAFPAQARLHYAALFASRRSAAAIEDGLTHLMRQPVRLIEYQPRWRDIEREDRTRLGRSFASLGDDAVLGARVKAASDAFRVEIRAKSLRDYKTLLPGGTRFAVASEALNAFAPSHLEWDIALKIDEADARPARLDGQTQLGWTGWMTKADKQIVRGDAHLRRRTRVRRGSNRQ
ncbi:type VI secretion system baseplate subunit TssG [Sphingomonas jatrophae]|uniref:Type VI secretion system protein ImpH n=1 Tax=Sphingomonas jatrophae TaxID=1166337 RepID=A0A1I6LK02_9SPHN|nr:type VI secretion system baseplate subunit TssG [Sphingomonas jatrophae]SFS03743.1 type VI secretion system protein ImpH [Sphingomonas jatrophae]